VEIGEERKAPVKRRRPRAQKPLTEPARLPLPKTAPHTGAREEANPRQRSSYQPPRRKIDAALSPSLGGGKKSASVPSDRAPDLADTGEDRDLPVSLPPTRSACEHRMRSSRSASAAAEPRNGAKEEANPRQRLLHRPPRRKISDALSPRLGGRGCFRTERRDIRSGRHGRR
jgi:hypothetical protein